MKQTVVLIILDGWGMGQKSTVNPIYAQPTPTFQHIRTHYPCGSLQSAGIAVGLPWGEEGNSEVGHLTLGAGKVLYQHYPRITLAIKDGSFFKNAAFLGAIEHARQTGGALHLAGLFGKGNVHSSYDHIIALLKLAELQNFKNAYIHLFSDGKDSPPKLGAELAVHFSDHLKKTGCGTIASISGRYYAMDRDDHWDRTERAHNAMIGKARVEASVETVFKAAYDKVHSDEFIEPAVIVPEGAIKDGDSLIFFDFREDSVRQIVESFIDPSFDKFDATKFSNLHVVTMTRYKDSFTVPVGFPPETVENPLGKVLADSGKTQLRIAETEKYAHVTYFFNGLRDKPYKDEYRVLVPSLNVPRHDEHPGMQTPEIASRLMEGINEGAYDFILVNFANSDIIAHTGNYEASAQAVSIIDRELGNIIKVVKEKNAIVVITSDHGNVEQVMDPFTGEPETKHNPNPVPIYLIANQFEREVDPLSGEQQEREIIGILSDVAPTLLELMKIRKHPEMTGESLLRLLR